MKKPAWLWLLILGLPFAGRAQIYRKPAHPKGALALYNDNFFYDKEYSNLIADGYTLGGHHFILAYGFPVDSSWFVQAGTDAWQFWGNNSRLQVRFHFALVYARGHHKLIIGQLDNRENHRLFRPLYDEEFRLRPDRSETGIQYLWQNSKHRIETWLDWHRFIHQGDTLRERLNWGLSADLRLTETGPWQWHFPVQVLIHHRGGQINLKGHYLKGKNDILSVLSAASGLQVQRRVNAISEVEFSALYFWHGLNSRNPEELGFVRGHAAMARIDWFTAHWNINLSYWDARKFSSPLGEAIYQTASRRVDKYYENGEVMPIFSRHREPHRMLWSSAVRYHTHFSRHLAFRAKVEMFFQPYRSSVPYPFIRDVVNHTDWLLSARIIWRI